MSDISPAVLLYVDPVSLRRALDTRLVDVHRLLNEFGLDRHQSDLEVPSALRAAIGRIAHADTRELALSEVERTELMATLDQTQPRPIGRRIASDIEAEGATIRNQLSKSNTAAIDDYVATFSKYNKLARQGDIQPPVRTLDKTIKNARKRRNTSSRTHVVFRREGYGTPQEPPYGQQSKNWNTEITEGDLVTNPAFTSTSGHRQLLRGDAVEFLPPVTVDFVMYQSSGVPIAHPDIVYSNKAEQRAATSTDTYLETEGPKAGQAEVLIPRYTVFVVTKIERQSPYRIKVLLEERPDPTSATAKNIHTGETVAVPTSDPPS
jgi:hypothetical protein